MVDSYKCAFKKRPEGRTTIIWILIVMFGVIDLLRGSERKADMEYIRDMYPFESFEEYGSWTKVRRKLRVIQLAGLDKKLLLIRGGPYSTK